MNFVILAAIIVQAIISRISLLAGSAVGFIIVIGILIWGLGAYSDGNTIAIVGIELSKTIFVVGCVIWLAIDSFELLKALNKKKAKE